MWYGKTVGRDRIPKKKVHLSVLFIAPKKLRKSRKYFVIEKKVRVSLHGRKYAAKNNILMKWIIPLKWQC